MAFFFILFGEELTGPLADDVVQAANVVVIYTGKRRLGWELAALPSSRLMMPALLHLIRPLHDDAVDELGRARLDDPPARSP